MCVTAGQSGGQTRGQSSKSGTRVKEATPRTSQRAIKRPRYYDDDDDNEQPKSGGSGKKTKAQPRSSKTNVNKKPTHPNKVKKWAVTYIVRTFTLTAVQYAPLIIIILIISVQQIYCPI